MSQERHMSFVRDDLEGEKARAWRRMYDKSFQLALNAGRSRDEAELDAYAMANEAIKQREFLEMKSSLTYWLFDAIVDNMSRPNHRVLEGALAPVGHPVWERLRPPLGWGCRCSLFPVGRTRAERMLQSGEAFDLVNNIPEGAGPDAGFVRPF